MKKVMRIMAITLTVLYVLFIAMSLSLVVLEAGHDCLGDHCPICEQISALTRTLRVTALFLLFAVALLAGVSQARKVIAYSRTEYTTGTPVELKTKLSN